MYGWAFGGGGGELGQTRGRESRISNLAQFGCGAGRHSPVLDRDEGDISVRPELCHGDTGTATNRPRELTLIDIRDVTESMQASNGPRRSRIDPG